MSAKIHPLADVQSNSIGEQTRIWQFVVILPGAKIGSASNICAHCLIENDVHIGDRVTIKSGVQLWDGLRIEDDVFIGPNVSFANDRFPRSQHYPDQFALTTIRAGASIGAGAVLLPGITIGERAMVGAGAVVTKSVPANAIVTGTPARIVGYVDTLRTAHPPQTQASPDHPPGVANTSVRGVSLHELPLVSDIRGALSLGEFERHIPFLAKRYFIVFDVPSLETRGEHAHKSCAQFLICIKGQCAVVADDGEHREEFLLNRPNLGLYLPAMIWGIQYRYSADALLLVFASEFYDPADYIRNYQEFLSASR